MRKLSGALCFRSWPVHASVPGKMLEKTREHASMDVEAVPHDSPESSAHVDQLLPELRVLNAGADSRHGSHSFIACPAL
eukprot:scaffold1201_cov247-Pinguiococcus_pyrenoidosus.AAC.5